MYTHVRKVHGASVAPTTTNSHSHSAMNLSCSLPGKTWFTHNALHWGLFLFLFCFLFVLLVLLAVRATGQEGSIITQNSRLGLLSCYLFLAFRADEVTEADTITTCFPRKAPKPRSDLGSLQDPASHPSSSPEVGSPMLSHKAWKSGVQAPPERKSAPLSYRES